MGRLYDVVFVRPPGKTYINCLSSNPNREKIDLTLAREQHQAYVSILKESGVQVIQLQPLEEFPDSVFMQDPALLGQRRTIIGRFGAVARRGEEQMLLHDLSPYRSMIGEPTAITTPGTLEGGDVVVTEKGIFVGESTRTNSDGVRQLTATLRDIPVRSVKTNLFHLLCGCSYLTDGDMTIVPELVSPDSFPGFNFITIPKEESYAADALYLGDGKVVIPSGHPRSVMKLKGAGYRLVEADMSEFQKGDGGVTCLCSPVYKVL